MRPRHAGSLALVALLLAGCGSAATDTAAGSGGTAGSASSSGPTGAGTASAEVAGVVTVLAAASLTRPFTTLARAFEQAHPGTTVRLSFGSSTTLAQQVAQGADADLLATAGTAALGLLGEVSPTGTTTIARNTLEIATPTENPARVDSLADLGREDVDVVLCAASVPCGKAADEVLARAGVRANVVSREVDVSATLAKVSLGEADAAVVYHSDVVSARGEVAGVEIPSAVNTTLDYPLARLDDEPATSAFAGYVVGPQGRAALTAAGFLPP